MRVLVVTEIRLYRDGVADALERLPDVDQVLTAATPAAAVVTARRIGCDVVLLDMTIPDSTSTARSLVTARPSVKVVALGVPEDGPEVVACAEVGVAGYVSRDASLEDLGEALRSAIKGEVACSGKVAAGLIRHIARQAHSSHLAQVQVQLTHRERDVLRLLESGMTNKEIARALDIQLSTVKNHMHSLLSKSGAAGRADVVGALHRSARRQPST